jgi:CelD/BcsL family acetyltransferase involved in cellulose biosynthesis
LSDVDSAQVIRNLDKNGSGGEFDLKPILSSYSNNLSCVGGHEPKGQSCSEDRVMVETFHSFDVLLAMQQEWDDFMESVGAEVFLTFDWCRVWWNYYGKDRDLMVFIFRKKNALCGILPMFGDRIRLGLVSIKVLRIVGTDFTPVAVTIPIRQDSLSEVMRSLLLEINSNKCHWDLLHFGPICGRYESFTILQEACKKEFRIRATETEAHTYIRVAASWNDQLASLGKKQREEIRRKYERLIQKSESFECIDATEETFPQLFDEFVSTHQFHWNKLGRPGHYRAWPSAYDFHRALGAIQLRLGRLRFYQLTLNGNCIGYRYAYKFGDTYYCFLYARKEADQQNKIDFARIDFGEMVKRGLAERVKWLDLMRGEYPHKMQIGGQLFKIKNIYIYRNRLPSLLKVSLFRKLAQALNISYYKIWRTRIAPKVGSQQSPLWKLWIRTNTLSD